MCFIVPTEGETLCAEVETHNSKIKEVMLSVRKSFRKNLN
jgi:hypothetical protein